MATFDRLLLAATAAVFTLLAVLASAPADDEASLRPASYGANR